MRLRVGARHELLTVEHESEAGAPTGWEPERRLSTDRVGASAASGPGGAACSTLVQDTAQQRSSGARLDRTRTSRADRATHLLGKIFLARHPSKPRPKVRGSARLAALSFS